MKICLYLTIYVFIFISFIYSKTNDTTKVFDRDSVRIYLTETVDLATKHFILKEDSINFSVIDTIKLSASFLIELLKPPFKEPPQSFLESIMENIELINAAMRIENSDSTLPILDAVKSDLLIKSQVVSRGDDEVPCYERIVKVRTQKLINNDYIFVNGYTVKGIPWAFRFNLEPKFTFNNNTSPYSEKILTIGEYYLWVEKAGTSKRFPEEMRKFEVEFDPQCRSYVISIEVE